MWNVDPGGHGHRPRSRTSCDEACHPARVKVNVAVIVSSEGDRSEIKNQVMQLFCDCCRLGTYSHQTKAKKIKEQ